MTKEEEYKKDLRREEMRLRGNAAKKRQREKILQQIRDIDKRHWNGAKFYADQIAPRCKMTKNKKIFYRVMDIVGD